MLSEALLSLQGNCLVFEVSFAFRACHPVFKKHKGNTSQETPVRMVLSVATLSMPARGDILAPL
jgi:hypothetical protein